MAGHELYISEMLNEFKSEISLEFKKMDEAIVALSEAMESVSNNMISVAENIKNSAALESASVSNLNVKAAAFDEEGVNIFDMVTEPITTTAAGDVVSFKMNCTGTLRLEANVTHAAYSNYQLKVTAGGVQILSNTGSTTNKTETLVFDSGVVAGETFSITITSFGKTFILNSLKCAFHYSNAVEDGPFARIL